MLDLHLGLSIDSAAKTIPRFQFGESAHAKIFAEPSFVKSKFPKLAKMEDYYADSLYITEELPELIKEIDEAIKQVTNDVAVSKALHTFRSTCEEALKSDMAIFCFAD